MGSGGERDGGSPQSFVLVCVRQRAAHGGSFESRGPPSPPSRRRRARPSIRRRTTGVRLPTRRALPDGSDSASLATMGLESSAHPLQSFVAVDQFGLAFANLTDAAIDLGGPRLLPLFLRE